MLAKVRSFWLRSFESDRTAFYFELVSFIFTVGASLTLAITAADPHDDNLSWILHRCCDTMLRIL